MEENSINSQYKISTITADTLKSSNVLQLVWSVFEEFEAYQYGSEGFEDKDFIFGTTGIEIKFTSSKTPKLRISSERQLDTQNLDELFLVLYTAEEVKENGFSLNSMIEQTRHKLSNAEELKFFNEKW